MRNAFADEITALAGADERIILLSGDIGNRLFNRYKENYPDRFFNCGVAEANMIGAAAGMAISGLRPVAYTIDSFITARCFEQIKIDVCYHNLPVIIVGVGGGLSYASNGATHQSCEDIAIMRSLPNLNIVCPGDAWEVRGLLKAALKLDAPVYIRLGKKNEPLVHRRAPEFTIGKAVVIREGGDVCLLSAGTVLPITVEAADLLGLEGVDAQVVSFHTIKPLDEEILSEVFERFSVVVTIEEHSLIGGLGGAVAEWMADRPRKTARLLRIGTPDEFIHLASNQQYARSMYGLTGKRIAEKTMNILNFDEMREVCL